MNDSPEPLENETRLAKIKSHLYETCQIRNLKSEIITSRSTSRPNYSEPSSVGPPTISPHGPSADLPPSRDRLGKPDSTLLHLCQWRR